MEKCAKILTLGDFKYECGHCNRKFFSRAQYGIHLKKYHLISLKQVNATMRSVQDLLEMAGSSKTLEEFLEEGDKDNNNLSINKVDDQLAGEPASPAIIKMENDE